MVKRQDYTHHQMQEFTSTFIPKFLLFSLLMISQYKDLPQTYEFTYMSSTIKILDKLTRHGNAQPQMQEFVSMSVPMFCVCLHH